MAASRNSLTPDALLTRVADFVATRVPRDQPLCVAFSGGRDSVVLLHLLSRCALGNRLSALHVHHGLSPNASDWADFCAAFAADLGIRFEQRSVQVVTESRQGLEASARDARFAAFAEAGVSYLFLGHHRDDQAETLLFNLMRGSGVAGLAAMRPERRRGQMRLMRPLLDVPRAVLEAYADQHGLRWIEDESNEDRRFSRNFLRHEVIPVLRRQFPGMHAALSRMAEHSAEAEDLLGELAEQDWMVVADQDAADLQALRHLSPARIKNLLRYRLRQLGWGVPEASRLDEFVRQLLSAGPDRHPELTLPEGRMRIARRRLSWLQNQ